MDNDIAVALSGGAGPDIVYGSGPAFVAGYAAEVLLQPASSDRIMARQSRTDISFFITNPP